MNKQTTKLLKLHNKVITNASTLRKWKQVCPRRYRVPKDYYDPAWFSCLMLGVSGERIEGVGSPHYDFQRDISFKVCTMLEKYMYPHYFLDNDLIKLLGMTNVANDVDLTQMKFPFDACLFTLPVGLIEDKYNMEYDLQRTIKDTTHKSHAPLVNGAKSYLSQIGYARSYDVQTMSQEVRSKELGRDSTDGRHYMPDFSENWSRTLAMEDEEKRTLAQDHLIRVVEKQLGEPCRVIPSFSVVMGYDTGDVGVTSYPIEEGRGLSSILRSYEDDFFYGNEQIEVEQEGVQEEISSMQMLTKLVVTLILYMGSRGGEYSTEQKKTKFQHKGRTISNLYSPNFLGAKYKGYIQKQNNKMMGSFRMKPHWRKGHIHTYWTGKGRTKSVQKWVMPYPVNMEEKKSA